MIADIVRRRAMTAAPQQRPEVEGPAARLPFSLTLKARPHALPVIVAAEVFIDGARLLGVSPGDTFRLQPAGEGDPLGTAVVQRLDDQRAVLSVDGVAVDALPRALEAVPLTTAVPQLAVRLNLTGPTGEALLAELEASPRLRLAQDAGEPVLATISGDSGLVVRDVTGAPLHAGTLADDEAGRRRALELVELLAKAERLRALGSGEGDAYLDAPVAIELAHHGVEGREVVPLHGTQLFNGQPISVRISNGSNTPVYIWLFDVGVANTITLVTNDAPSGFRLGYSGTPGDSRTIGGTAGMALSWPSRLPADGPRAESLVVILSDQPQDLRGLESSPSGERGMATSPLDAILEEVREGTREWSSREGAAPLRYRVERVDFMLDPRPEPDLAEPEFEVDERPHLSLRMLQPRAAEPPPERVSVLLAELAIRPTGALANAAVRVDRPHRPLRRRPRPPRRRTRPDRRRGPRGGFGGDGAGGGNRGRCGHAPAHRGSPGRDRDRAQHGRVPDLPARLRALRPRPHPALRPQAGEGRGARLRDCRSMTASAGSDGP
ncbi:MAG: DUF4384 domain-containing protein [Actinobacteria bacterium]|nr:DUF4384 domain-containing protein [Actinomycetota bacterium]